MWETGAVQVKCSTTAYKYYYKYIYTEQGSANFILHFPDAKKACSPVLDDNVLVA